MAFLVKDRPTVTAETGKRRAFDVENDINDLNEAMDGIRNDVETIIEIVTRRTWSQRQLIKVAYEIKFGTNLIEDLQKNLRGDCEEVIVALLTPLPLFLAQEVHMAMDGRGYNEKILCDVLCTQNNDTMTAIKEAYEGEYGSELVEDICDETRGDFKRLLKAMCAADRDEHNFDFSVASDLSQALFDAGEDRWGTNESEFIRILSSYSYPVLRRTFKEYEKLSEKTFEEVIADETSGDLQEGLTVIYQVIKNKNKFYADSLQEALSDGIKRTLARIMVARCEIDLATIKEKYLKHYERTLEEAVEANSKHNFQKILLAILEE